MIENLILENDCEIDIPDTMQEILKHSFLENRHIWTQFKEMYWPKNRTESMEVFFNLPAGANIVTQTVFVDWQQLEIMVLVLEQMMDKNIPINLYVLIEGVGLIEKIKKYLSDYESDICPDTDEYNFSPKKREKFKQDMNKKLLKVIRFHKVYDMSRICAYKEYFQQGIKRVNKKVLSEPLKYE